MHDKQCRGQRRGIQGVESRGCGCNLRFQTTDDPEGHPEGTFLKHGSSNFDRNYCYQAAVTKRVERTSRVGKDGNRISLCEIWIVSDELPSTRQSSSLKRSSWQAVAMNNFRRESLSSNTIKRNCHFRNWNSGLNETGRVGRSSKRV